jgi:hypothetical protein
VCGFEALAVDGSFLAAAVILSTAYLAGRLVVLDDAPVYIVFSCFRTSLLSM